MPGNQSKIVLDPPKKTRQPVKKPGRREAKADETRRALFSAAAEVVGKHGYEGASVARITEAAGVASGTFYNYFETRQDLFDQLLPAIGEQLLGHIRQSVHSDAAGADLERERVIAYFDFFQQNRGFLRVLNEAVVFAPRAFKQHVREFASRYFKSLKHQRDKGEIGPISDDQLEATTYIFLGARTYLTMFLEWAPAGSRKDARDSIISGYIRLVEQGLFLSDGSNPTP